MLGGETLGTLRVNIEANLKDFNTSISSAQASLRTWGQSMTNIVQQHQHALTMLGTSMAGVGAVLVGGVGMAVKTFADFESAMKNVQSISNATQKEFEDLSTYAMKLGKDTVFSSKQAAEALYYMASAGYSVKDQMKATDSVLQLATATQWGLAQAAEFTATTITSFGLKAENAGHVADVMAKATAMSQATMEKLGYSLPYVSTQAHMLGMSLETTTAALSLLYDGGLKGEMAGERLRGALNSLLEPTDKEKEALERMGITLESVSPATHKLSEIVKVFEDHTKLAGDAQWNAANAAKIFGERAEGMTVLVAQGSAKLIDYETALNNSTGAAKKMADIQQEALSKSFEQLKGSIENLLIKMGGELAPTVKAWAGAFEGLTDKLSDLSPNLQTTATFFTTLSGGIGLASGAAIIFLAKIPDLQRGAQALAAMGVSLKVAFLEIAAVVTAISISWMLINKAMRESADPQNIAIKQFNGLKNAVFELDTQIAVLKYKGIDPLNMTLGEFSKSSYWAKESLEKLYPALGATYDENTKLSVIMSEIQKKTSDYTTGLIEQTAGLKVALPTIKEVANAHHAAGNATGELTEAEKKLLDQMKGELNPAFEKSAEIFQNIRLDTGVLKVVTDELGFSYKALTPIIHEMSKRTQEDAEQTWNITLQAFNDTKKGMVELAIADANLFNSQEALNAIRRDAVAHIAKAEQKAYDVSITNALTYWGKKIDVDNKFQNDVTKITGDAIAERNAGFDEDATKKLIKDADQYQKEETQLLKFASNKAKIYESEKEQLALTYVDMYNLAVSHGKNTNDIEKWYHDENLRLTMQYYENYVNTAQDAYNSITNFALGLLNNFSSNSVSMQDWASQIKSIEEKSGEDTRTLIQKQKDAELKIIKDYQFSILDEKEQEKIKTRENYDALIELYKKYGMDTKELTDARHKAMRQIEIDSWKDSLIDMATWVDNQVKLLKDLEDAYVSVTKVIGILGTVIDWLSGKSGGSSGGGIGDLTSILGSLGTGGAASGGTSIAEMLGMGGMTGGTTTAGASAVGAGAGGTSWLGTAGSIATGVASVAALAATVGSLAYGVYKMTGGGAMQTSNADWASFNNRVMGSQNAYDATKIETSPGVFINNLTDSLKENTLTLKEMAKQDAGFYANSGTNVDLTFGGNAPEKSIRGGTNIRVDMPMISGIMRKVGDDSKITSNLLSDGLRQVNTTLVDKIDTTNKKLDELIKRTPPYGGFVSVNQSAIDTVANLVFESARRRNML